MPISRTIRKRDESIKSKNRLEDKYSKFCIGIGGFALNEFIIRPKYEGAEGKLSEQTDQKNVEKLYA